jgi:hypothetical protein
MIHSQEHREKQLKQGALELANKATSRRTYAITTKLNESVAPTTIESLAQCACPGEPHDASALPANGHRRQKHFEQAVRISPTRSTYECEPAQLAFCCENSMDVRAKITSMRRRRAAVAVATFAQPQDRTVAR